jgi:nucleoside-triphosphatase THEP1
MSARVAARIGVIVGPSGPDKRALLAEFARRRRQEGLRVAGLVEATEKGTGACGALSLTDLATGDRIAISQDLGPGSTACNLDPSGVARACAAAQKSVGGADLMVLSKFGKLEAAGQGLRDAFAAAVMAGVPVVTTLHPLLLADWTDFAGDFSDRIEAQAESLDLWWRRVASALAAA